MAISYNLIPNSDGSQWTNYPSGDAPVNNLPVPTNLNITNIQTNQMTLNWTFPSSGTSADGFIIQMWEEGVSTSWTTKPAPNPTPSLVARSAIQVGLKPSTNYGWRIASKNGVVTGTFLESWL